MKKILSVCFLFFMIICHGSSFLHAQNCPPVNNPDYTISCYDDIFDYSWCCPPSHPICYLDYDYDTFELIPYCLSDSASSTTSVPSGSTTIPAGSTSTIPGGSDTTTIPTGSTSTIPGGSDTTTVPAGSTSTIPSGTTTIPSGPAEYLVGINITGADEAATEPSGTLPGTSFTEDPPLFSGKDGRLRPLWYDPFYPTDPLMVKQAKELLEREQRMMPVRSFAVGETGQFWVKDDSDMAWRQVSATVKKSTTHSNIFLDNTLTVSDASLELYATEFEVMYSVLGNNIGTFTDRNGDGKIAILLYDFNDTGSAATGFMAGYFWSKDYFPDAQTQAYNMRSNEMDIIYIRGDLPLRWEETGLDFYENNLTTLVHEYQHLVHFGIKVWSQGDSGKSSDAWIDEMMAMASETMYFKQKLQDNPAYTQPSMEGNGYLKDRIDYYSLDPKNSIRNGHGLNFWDRDGDVYSNYSLSYIFGQYLSLQASNGQAIFKAILDYMIANGVHDYQAIAGVASQSISGINSWEAILKNFAIANVANQPSGPFGYNGQFQLTAHGPTMDTANIHNGGAVYRKISGAATVPAGAGSNIKFYDSNGTSIGSGTSASTTVPGAVGCTSELLFGGQSEETDLLRDFRDRVLRGSPAGEELIAIYYQHTDELSSIIMRDPLLRIRCTSLALRMLPAITSAIEENTLPLSIQDMAELNTLCDAIIGQASPDLAGLLRSLQHELNQDGSLLENLEIEVIE